MLYVIGFLSYIELYQHDLLIKLHKKKARKRAMVFGLESMKKVRLKIILSF
jgi:hypothetical protein